MLSNRLSAIEEKINSLIKSNRNLREQVEVLRDNKVMLEEQLGNCSERVAGLENQLREARSKIRGAELDDKGLREIKEQLQSYIAYIDGCIDKMAREKVAS